MKTVSLRLDEKILRKTSDIAEKENLDTSTMLRQSIVVGLDILAKKQAVEMYAKKLFSLSEAARFADVSPGEMVDILVSSGIKANYSLEEIEESFKSIGKLSRK